MQAGMDLTEFDSVQAFKNLLNKYNMKEVESERGFKFKGDDVTLVTGNHPITGEHRKNRMPEKAYASYIHIEGPRTEELFNDISSVSFTDGKRELGQSEFI